MQSLARQFCAQLKKTKQNRTGFLYQKEEETITGGELVDSATRMILLFFRYFTVWLCF